MWEGATRTPVFGDSIARDHVEKPSPAAMQQKRDTLYEQTLSASVDGGSIEPIVFSD
jgi:hypothetical protein